MGGPAGAAVTGGDAADVVAEALDESGATAAEAGAEVTGSGRSGLGSLMALSLGPSTLAVSGLVSRTRSLTERSPAVPTASVLVGSNLTESESGFAAAGLAESVAADSDLETSRDVSSSFALLPGTICSVFGGSGDMGLPRRPCFCRTPVLLSVAACTGACPSAGWAAADRCSPAPC